MSKLDWRNNKIHALTGDPKDDTILPTYAQYLVWQGNAERAITAVGANYLNNLIEKPIPLRAGVIGPERWS
eukprot:CAMPEP_0181346534 /NCGR_PEP_ID=MMETSP1101-20121128/33378_1 /TAXON_ID=46948 /ORGANISM="Rhodomonas abbreviata, Strain Caron Lab Isolate" /LENGTH=70 /DNA_ID=CAMNT_0023458651 /DNA_START=307 /DNA_END=519 /DNA_ORIENTATION=-